LPPEGGWRGLPPDRTLGGFGFRCGPVGLGTCRIECMEE
jgi:hypothetical protein